MIKEIDGEKYESNQEMLNELRNMKRKFHLHGYHIDDDRDITIMKDGTFIYHIIGRITGVKKNIQEGCWIFKVILRSKDNDLIDYLDSLDFNFSITIGDKT